MLKVGRVAYYYGEFGCLNYCILGHLERFQPKVSVLCRPDHLKLMRMKDQNIKGLDYEIDADIFLQDTWRGAGFGVGFANPQIDLMHKSGIVSLKEFLGLEEKMCIKHLLPIEKPLEYDIGLDKEYVNVSFRKRMHQPERNLQESNWGQILDYVREKCNCEIIAHGMDLDTISSERFGVKKAKNIEESIAYMNKSRLFIGSMSGVAQFASNCASPVLQIGDTSRHFHYDPFDKGCETAEFKNYKSAIGNFLK